MSEHTPDADNGLTIAGSVVVRSPMGVAGPDGTVVLHDTDPYRPTPTPRRFEVDCSCGALLTIDGGDCERGVAGLDPAAASGLGLIATERGWRGARGLDVSACRVRHHDAEVLVVIASGEAQPGRDMVVLHGVAEVIESAPDHVVDTASEEASSLVALAVFVAAGLALVALVGWIHWSAISAYTGQNELERSGTQATALVLDARADTGPREVDEFVLETTFVTGDGREVEADYRVDENTFRAAPVGSSIEIRYDAADPDRSVVASNDAGAIGLAALVTIDALLIVLAFIAWWTSRRAARAANRA